MPRTSNKQEEILQYIDQFVTENGYPPSVREIGAAVGLRSTASVSYHLNRPRGLLHMKRERSGLFPYPMPKPGRFPSLVL